MIRRSVLVVLVAVLFAAAIPHGRLEAKNPRGATMQASKMYETNPVPPGAPPNPALVVVVPHSKSVLLRNDSGVAMRIHTRGLKPGHAYTIWWVFFNNPGQPGPPDAVMFAGGHVVGPNGVGNFAASRKVGDERGGSPTSTSLQNPRGAEVHLVIRDHGMMDPRLMPAQISTPFAGPYWKDVQFTIHSP